MFNLSSAVKAKSHQTKAAFTLVELLIVIVVIGILAGLIALAYNGLQGRAHVATLQNDLSNGSDLLAVDDLKDRKFPSSISEANVGSGLPKSQDVSLVYVPNSDLSGYCLQATYDELIYHVTDKSSKPAEGQCTIVPIAAPPEPPEPPVPALCSSYNVGQNGPAGGIIVYKAATQQTWGCYLEAAKSTSGGGWWCNSNNSCNEDTYVWGCRDTAVSTVNGIGRGMQSTTNIINACPYANAAYAARNYKGGNQNNWYLPNRAEMTEMMKFKTQLNIKHGSGWLAGSYWTSEQYNNAQGRNYLTGGTACFIFCVTVDEGFTHEYKNNAWFKFVRPVRTFS